jgi:LPS sulfotransferase NodH
MWGTMTELTDALGSGTDSSTASDVELLTEAFGRTRFVHLRRDDTVAQAVSWARAEQTHFWHPGEPVAPGVHKPHFDRDLIGGLVDTITAHEAAWQAWFAHRGLVPHEVAYEDLGAAPTGVTRIVLEFLGLDPSAGGTITVHDHRQADDLSADWIARFRG